MDSEKQTVIEKALNGQWQQLHALVKRHYKIYPGNNEQILISGVMTEIYHSRTAKLFLLLGRVFGALVPYKGKKIPTTVKNWTEAENDKAMFWYRTMLFPGRKPVIFCSRMEYVQDNEITEYVRFGLGIRMLMTVENGALVFTSINYTWNIGVFRISIPSWLILGDARIVEKAISDEQFFIDFRMIHPWFGKTFSYSGNFSIDSSHE